MKNIVLIALLLTAPFCIAQQVFLDSPYFKGDNLHCTPKNSEAKEKFDKGVKLLHLNYDLNPKYLALNADIFAQAILKDTTFCDAYFFAGYVLNLQHKYREAFAFLKVGDSLSGKQIEIYKINLAAVCIKVGLVEEAIKQYDLLKQNFPNNPEGYYGLAMLSVGTGKEKEGLENIKTAINLYDAQMKTIGPEVNLLYGILSTYNGMYENAIKEFEKCRSTYKKLDHFLGNYAYCLYKIGKKNNDEKQIKKGLAQFKKVTERQLINPEFVKEMDAADAGQ